MRDVAFGQYYPSKSFVHRADPRTKILFLIVYIVAVFLSANFYALGACAALFLIAAIFSGVPFYKLLRSVKGVLFLLVFMAILNLFFYQGETVWWSWKFITITKEAVFYTIFLSVRLFLLVLGSSLLTLTTTPVSLADGIESLLSPLKLIRASMISQPALSQRRAPLPGLTSVDAAAMRRHVCDSPSLDVLPSTLRPAAPSRGATQSAHPCVTAASLPSLCPWPVPLHCHPSWFCD